MVAKEERTIKAEPRNQRIQTALELLAVASDQFEAALRVLDGDPTGVLFPDEYAALTTNCCYLKSIRASMQQRAESGSSMIGDADHPVIASQLDHLIELDLASDDWTGTVKRRDVRLGD